MAKEPKKEPTSNDCFIIMPIADIDGYDKGHFKKVYEDIFKVACEKGGFNPVRADEVKQTNLIHLDILQKLIESPIAICDLSNRNPNVLFELGLRQAFDKPTVLVQEIGTPKIFDISPLRYTEYRRELKYREVLEDQDFIADALRATKEATDNGEGVNSIVSLLSLSSPASLKDVTDNDAAKMLQIVMSEMNDLRADFRQSIRRMDAINNPQSTIGLKGTSMDYIRFNSYFSRLKRGIEEKEGIEVVKSYYDKLLSNYSKLSLFEMTHVRKVRIEEILSDADLLFSKYVVENKK